MGTQLYRMVFNRWNHPHTSEIYTLSLHDALPISITGAKMAISSDPASSAISIRLITLEVTRHARSCSPLWSTNRSEEHTSELQSHVNLVCRLLLEKKKTNVGANISYVGVNKSCDQ